MTHQHVHRRGWRRALMTLLMLSGFILIPLTGAQANPLCPGNPAPFPESAGSGPDGLMVPPQSQSSVVGANDGMPPDASMYGQYGTSGQQWHIISESCVDAIGSGAQGVLTNSAWNLSKTINQSTITVYQAATSDGLLANFDQLIIDVVSALREGIWRPLIPTLVILGALTLGWYGLVRKRLTFTLESAAWMVASVMLGMWILVSPGHISGLANSIVNSGTQLVTSTVGQIPYAGAGTACPVGATQPERASWESEADYQVRRNADMLWSSLVCQPWVAGQFGSSSEADFVAREHALETLESQGISRIEQQQIDEGETTAQALIEEKQENYGEIASRLETTYPAIYPMFSGQDQDGRFGVATLALFASIFAGGLILAASIALIVLKIGFILLFMLAPIFLLIGIHPGYGRTVLLRWIELMLGLLLKQIFVVLLLSLLVMCFGMVMSAPLGWGLQMILLAMFTLAAVIYRKPFANLFASVNANTFTSRIVSDAAQSQALTKSAAILPPVAYMKAQNWGRRRSAQIAAGAAGVPANGNAAAIESGEEAPESTAARGDGARARGSAGYGRVRGNDNAPPLNVNRTGGPGIARPTSGPRSSDQAPDLGGSSSGGGVGAIPPRPAGGYTGTGDSGWAGVFGTGGGNRPNRNDSGGSGSGSGGGTFGGGSGNSRAANAERAEPSTGRGIFSGREETPAQGNFGSQGSRWGGPKEKRDRPAPQRSARPAPADRSRRGDSEGGWLTGSGKRNDNAPITPFWGESGSSSSRDRKRDVPFWLNDD